MDSMRTKTRITLIFPIDGEAAGGILFWAADHQNFYVAEIFTEGAYEVLKDDLPLSVHRTGTMGPTPRLA
jgi:hypothetical protein